MQIVSAFRFALAGIVYCIQRECHMKIHLSAAFTAIGLACWLELSRVEIMILLITIGGVITAEIFNTALEAIVDKISPEHHPLAKAAKDAAAGAVLVQAVISLGVGYLLFWDKLLK